MIITSVFGCAVSSLTGFGYHDPWNNFNGETEVKRLRDELDALLKYPHGASYPAYTRKLLAVVTSGQPAALQMLQNHPKARLISKTMNYRFMNYIFEITTEFHNKILSEDIPHPPEHLSLKKRIEHKTRKGIHSGLWNRHVNKQTTA